jgi:transposase
MLGHVPSAVIARAIAAGLDWPAVQALTDDALEAKLYPSVAAASERAMPDCAYIHVERRKTGVTLELLHLEYLEKHPNGYRYTQFCERYREWLDKRHLTMRQEHRAGGEVLRRLLRQEAAHRRSEDRRGDRGRALRRGARRVQLHVRRRRR